MTLPSEIASLDPAQIPLGELAQKMGIVLASVTPAEITATMPVVGNRQPFDLLHGGASAALAETIGSIHAAITAGEGRLPVGVELSCTHHRSAREGFVTATSTPLHLGRQMASFQIAIVDDAERAVCTARLTCFLRTF